MLDGKHIIEAVVDLQNNKLLSWQPIKDAHGMVLLGKITPGVSGALDQYSG